MALKRREIEQLIARLGKDNVLYSEADRIVYSTDVGSPPAIIDLLAKRKADAVARCHDISDVETVVTFCRNRRIPMTPRAAATNALGGAVPKRAGVVLDLTPMNRRVEIDEAAAVASVDAGVVIQDLRDRLNEVGLDLPCYPTSGLAATIGGFVAMDGHGIGSTAHGSIGRHVLEVEGVGPNGGRFRARDREEMEFYLGMGGSTGVITSIKLRLVEAVKEKPVLVKARRWRAVQSIIEEATARFAPRHAMFRSSDFFKLRNEAMGVRKNPIGDNQAVLFSFSEGGFDEDAFARMVERHGGELLDEKTAQAEWDERFYPIKFKRLGPSLVAGESFVPVARIRDYLKRLADKVQVSELSVEGHVTDDGRVYFFITTLDDERRPNYPLAWGTSEWIIHLATKLGGRPYHSGAWLQWHSKKVFGKTRYRKLKAFKKQGDVRNLMNPGTVFPMPAPVPEFVYKAPILGPIPAPSLGFQLWAGGPVLRMLGGGAKHRRRKTLGVRASDIAADMVWGQDMAVRSDLIWGFDSPSAQAIPNPGDLPMTQTVRGKMVLAKAMVQGRIADPWELKQSLDVADPDPEDAKVCPEYEEIQEVLDAFRRTVEAQGVALEVQAPELPEEDAVEVAAHPEVENRESGMSKEEILAKAKETPEEEKAWVVAADCIVCNGCEAACPTDAAIVTDMARVDRDLCIADGACFDACPTGAIRPGIEDEKTSGGWPEGSRLAGKFGV